MDSNRLENERALQALATPRCEETLRDLADVDDLDLHAEAERLLEDVDDVKPP